MKKKVILKKIKSFGKKIGVFLKKLVKIIKVLLKNLVKFVKSFSDKKFGKYTGKQVLCLVGIILLVLIVGSTICNTIDSKVKDYPVVYKSNENKLLLLKQNSDVGKEVKLSSEGLASDVMYANTTERYLLFVKNDGLYLYDSKSKEETTKLVSNISDYYKFTEDDKYIVMMDDNNNLYVYNYRGEKEVIDRNIKTVEGLSKKNIIYIKEGALYIKGLKAAKKDSIKIVDGIYQARVTNDGKKVYYIDSSRELYEYNVSKKKNTKIDTGVSQLYMSEETGKMYYLTNDTNRYYTAYYYNGKNSEKVSENVSSVVDYDADKEQLLYLTSEDYYTLYYQKGTKKAQRVDNKFSSSSIKAYIHEDEIYYVNSKNELKYTKIRGSKLGRIIKVSKNVESELYVTKKGYVYLSDLDDNSNGKLYIASGGTARKIDSNVRDLKLKVSNNGKKIYYLKDFEKNAGTLCVSSGRKGKEIAKDIYSYQYVNDKLMYYVKNYSLSGNSGDLYRYDGNHEKIASGVYGIATMPNSFKLDK